jgi:hypothetical protein
MTDLHAQLSLNMNDVLELVKTVWPIVVPTTALLSLTGLVPRIGPGRAVWIAFRSRFAPKKIPESIRVVELRQIRKSISEKNFGQGYLVVTGDKGVGKSCLLSTSTSKTCGIINVKVEPGDKGKDIIRASLQNLVNMPFDFIPPHDSARRVVFWYQLFSFGNTPTIIINATERKIGQESASLTGAVRTLVDDYKLRVIVDGSPNSIDESLLNTERADVIDIKPMTKDMIWSLPQLQAFFSIINKTDNLADIMWAVLGGIPARYEKIWRKFERLRLSVDAKQLIGELLCDEISSAIKIVEDSKTISNMTEIIELFDKEQNGIIKHQLTTKKLIRPTPDKVFHEMKKDKVFMLVPASNAIGIVLHHNLTKEPTLETLEKLVLPVVGTHMKAKQ